MTNLDALTTSIKSEIKRQYRSIRKFAVVVGIPQTTISSALNKGIGSISFEAALKICECLHISFIDQGNPSLYINYPLQDFIEMYSQLDDEGRKTVNTVICAELLRSKKVSVSGVVKAFGGNTFLEQMPSYDQSAFLALQKIKEQHHA